MSTREELAPADIDKQIETCGWTIQSPNEMNRYVAPRAAVREFPLETRETAASGVMVRVGAEIVEDL